MSENARFRLFVMIVSSYHHYLTHTFSGRCVCVGCILEAVAVSACFHNSPAGLHLEQRLRGAAGEKLAWAWSAWIFDWKPSGACFKHLLLIAAKLITAGPGRAGWIHSHTQTVVLLSGIRQAELQRCRRADPQKSWRAELAALRAPKAIESPGWRFERQQERSFPPLSQAAPPCLAWTLTEAADWTGKLLCSSSRAPWWLVVVIPPPSFRFY